jgi:hypothetical protein
MKEDEVLSGLESVMTTLGVQVRYEKGDFAGGLCKLKDKQLLILNSAMPPNQKIKILASELSQMELDNVFMVPALRQVIDDVGKEKG